MQSEWRREQEQLKESRALRAATRASRAECRTSVSGVKQALRDVKGQLTKAMVAVAQSYAMLAGIEKILTHNAQFAAPSSDESTRRWRVVLHFPGTSAAKLR